MKRQRGRSRKGNNNNHNHGNRSFDSNGPEVKVRGNASQVYDKYTALARDAMSSGNRVKAENLRQHGEHYLRITNAQEAAKQAAREEADARREKHNERQNEKTEKQGEKQASGDDEKNKSDGSNNERRPRRQPRAPRYKDNESKSDSNETADALEVVKPEPSDIVDAKDEAPKPARRRKAPTKPKAPKPDVAVDAAE